MLAALGWGALAASSLLLGVALAFARRWPVKWVGLVLAFGAGALISAISFELALEGAKAGGLGVTAIGLAAGAGISVGLLVAIFVSNLPEAIGSATQMEKAGTARRTILRLWLAVAAICTLAAVAGYALADVTAGDFQAIINGFAAGALIVMLIDSMIPEATREAGRTAGLVTTLGFAVATALSAAS